MSEPSPPPPTATPAEVRTYFTHILTTLHFVPDVDARKIAAKWQFGRGSELKYYDQATFREIFGWEAGTVLCGHARGELKAGKGSNKTSVAVVDDGTVNNRPEKDIFGLTPGCESPF
jgi:hypothetical protein